MRDGLFGFDERQRSKPSTKSGDVIIFTKIKDKLNVVEQYSLSSSPLKSYHNSRLYKYINIVDWKEDNKLHERCLNFLK